MCNYCDADSMGCCIFQDPLSKKYYLVHYESSYEDYDIADYDMFLIKDTIPIKFCPFCGRKLDEQDVNPAKNIHPLKIPIRSK